jgi:hypothetical protein
MRRTFFIVFTALLLLAVTAFAQNYGTNVPRNGACFYRESGFRGPVFCVRAGEYLNGVPDDFDDRISSIQIFGRATVTVYDDHDFRGDYDMIDRSAPKLENIRKTADRGHTWNNRISSVRVDWLGGRASNDDDRDHDRGNWDRNRDRDRDRNWSGDLRWGRGSQPREGACFYRQTEFRGDYFCIERGRSITALPREFNDAISSIRIFGNARVLAYQNADFRGARAAFGRDSRDLRDKRSRSNDWDRDWNNRISSLEVR